MKITISSGDIYADKEMKLITKVAERVYNDSRCLEFTLTEKELDEVSKMTEMRVDKEEARIYYVEYAGQGNYRVYVRTKGETKKI